MINDSWKNENTTDIKKSLYFILSETNRIGRGDRTVKNWNEILARSNSHVTINKEEYNITNEEL